MQDPFAFSMLGIGQAGSHMSDQEEKTREAQYLEAHPDVRRRVAGSQEFQAWKDQLPSVVVDDVRYYIRGGDMLRDEDQLIYEWAERTGVLRP